MPLSRKGCCYLHPKKGRGLRMIFVYGLGDTTILLGKADYDLDLNLADFIEKFRTVMERSDFSSG
jgi:hypothetical protein